MLEADEYLGIEISEDHCAAARALVADPRVRIVQADIFGFSTRALLRNAGDVLVLGNPPWVLSSAMSAIGAANLPYKANFKRHRGIDALTGSGNFDICEAVILQLVREYAGTSATVCMLCKTSVARSVYAEMCRQRTGFSRFDVLEFDARQVFGVSAAACVLVSRLDAQPGHSAPCRVFDFDAPSSPKALLRYANGRLLPDVAGESPDSDGHCCFEWRQGVKHDCAPVMVLTEEDGVLRNGLGETVAMEPDLVYPLVKSSMFKTAIVDRVSKRVIVPQRRIGESTAGIEQRLPKTWAYLTAHADWFEKRKSAVYAGAPPFSVFGVGPYAFSRFKVGVSGFYKKPMFSLLLSEDGRPVMVDDTAYYICFDRAEDAYVAMLALNAPVVQQYLLSIAFLDAKRPWTKKVLERLDFARIMRHLPYEALADVEESLGLGARLSPADCQAFQRLVENEDKGAGQQSMFDLCN